jgi:hypothetical protein
VDCFNYYSLISLQKQHHVENLACFFLFCAGLSRL